MTLLLTNAAILGGSSVPVWHPAMVVADGKICALGDPDVLRTQFNVTNELDLEGRTVIPGFIDAHVHPIEGGQELISCALSEGTTVEDYRVSVDHWAAQHPERTWVIGAGWSMDAFDNGIPHSDALEGLADGRPIFLMNRDGHSAWVNRRALELAGIDESVPDPDGGRIERDADGRPTGALHEAAAELVRVVLPLEEVPDATSALRAAQDYLVSLGITGWQDAGIRTTRGYDKAYRALIDDGSLLVEVEGAQWLSPDFESTVVEQMIALRDEFATSPVSMGSVKIMLDGVLETHTAHLKYPYLSDDHDDTGLEFFDADRLLDVAARLDAAGFHLHFHAVGDAALRQAIDVVAHCRAVNGWTEGVHHVAHVQVVDQTDLDDIRRVGLAINAQTLWARLEPYVSELAIPVLGDQRGYEQYPFRSFLQHGIAIGAGSDWSVSTPRPFHQIHVAVNRRPVPKASTPPDVAVFAPDERLDLLQAIRNATIGSAHLCDRAERTGSLEVGKDADFVVLDRDVFSIKREDIWQTQVEETWIRGERVYRA